MITLGSTPGSAAHSGPGGPDGSGQPTDRGDWLSRIAASPRPAIVDYTGDRTELSGRVLANWAAKTANLLDAEGYGPGTPVTVDLAAGWLGLAVVLGAARAGVVVSFPAGAGASPTGADLILSDAPERWGQDPAELWALPAPGAAGATDGTEETDGTDDWPDHALDAVAEVRAQADTCPLPIPGGSLTGVVAGFTDDAGPAGGAAQVTGRSRHERGLVLSRPGRLDAATMRDAAAQWERGLPVLLLPQGQQGPEGGPAQAERIIAAERLGDPLRD